MDAQDVETITAHLQQQFAEENFRVTLHAQQEMVEDGVTVDEVKQAIRRCRLLENYPQHQRGACGLLYGVTDAQRIIHVVCTTTRSTPIVITVYEPKPPKWFTPLERGDKR